jgi:capping protein beta
MRRLPPQQIESNLSDLIDLVPDLCEDLLSSVDQPLKIARDAQVGKDYLLCDYNRDGDSYRSVFASDRGAFTKSKHCFGERFATCVHL